jgi:hypothetical protein
MPHLAQLIPERSDHLLHYDMEDSNLYNSSMMVVVVTVELSVVGVIVVAMTRVEAKAVVHVVR